MQFIIGFLILAVAFGLVERCFPLRREQKLFRRGWLNDVIHFFVNHLLVQIGVVIVAIPIFILLGWVINPELKTVVASQPSWLQFVEGLAIADLTFYFAHRMTHQIPFLWRFHTIHHSIEEMDWLASGRLHPIDQIFGKVVVAIPLYILGFTKETFGVYLAIGSIQALFIHANVRFRFGWLRWVFATPEFHHWHHSSDRAALNKNFAGQLPILDLLFGSLYMPKHQKPEKYGLSNLNAPMPTNYWQQILYPFQKL